MDVAGATREDAHDRVEVAALSQAVVDGRRSPGSSERARRQLPNHRPGDAQSWAGRKIV